MTTRAPVAKGEHIVIVGAGAFGLSTALELKKRGYAKVTVVDRYIPPVIDGSSVDISRVIRTDYADPLYGKMAREALEMWKSEYKSFYHESGFVMLADQPGHPYLEKSMEVNKTAGISLDVYPEARDVRKIYPAIQAELEGLKAYHNVHGGWADAEKSVQLLSMKCSLAGVSFITGPRGNVRSLKYSGRRVIGINVAEGEPILAAQVILATGAWSNRLVPISHATSASGQPVGFIQLTPDEAKKLEGMPVIINLSTGIFCFPPTPGTNIMKLARHGYGYSTSVETDQDKRMVSSPKRDSNNVDASYLPADAEEALREGLRKLLPEFEKHAWMNRRLCWYSDTVEGDFVFDHHPRSEGLFLATGGAGHGFKFMPVLGRYIVDCYENKASNDVRQKWRLRPGNGTSRLEMVGDGSRGGPPLRVLKSEEQAKL